jgi:hypothetical protein
MDAVSNLFAEVETRLNVKLDIKLWAVSLGANGIRSTLPDLQLSHQGTDDESLISAEELTSLRIACMVA